MENHRNALNMTTGHTTIRVETVVVYLPQRDICPFLRQCPRANVNHRNAILTPVDPTFVAFSFIAVYRAKRDIKGT